MSTRCGFIRFGDPAIEMILHLSNMSVYRLNVSVFWKRWYQWIAEPILEGINRIIQHHVFSHNKQNRVGIKNTQLAKLCWV